MYICDYSPSKEHISHIITFFVAEVSKLICCVSRFAVYHVITAVSCCSLGLFKLPSTCYLCSLLSRFLCLSQEWVCFLLLWIWFYLFVFFSLPFSLSFFFPSFKCMQVCKAPFFLCHGLFHLAQHSLGSSLVHMVRSWALFKESYVHVLGITSPGLSVKPRDLWSDGPRVVS